MITMIEPADSDRAHFTSYLPHVDEFLRNSDLRLAERHGDSSVGDTRPRGAWFLLIEPNELQEEGKFYLERMDRPQAFHSVRPTLEEIYRFPSVTASGVPAGSMETTAHLEFESVERFNGAPGQVLDGLTVACGEGALKLITVQRAGKAPMDADSFLRGFPLRTGDKVA